MLKRACIAIVDAAHARIFTYSQRDGQDPSLVEYKDLVSPGRQAHGMFSDRAPLAPGDMHGPKDDHRSDHLAELDARFAREVMKEVTQLVREQAYAHVVLVASPKMLANLRGECESLRKANIAIDEVQQDLAWLTPPQLHDRLAALDLIGPRRGATLRGARTR